MGKLTFGPSDVRIIGPYKAAKASEGIDEQTWKIWAVCSCLKSGVTIPLIRPESAWTLTPHFGNIR